MIVFTKVLTSEPAAQRLIDRWATAEDQGHASLRRTAAAEANSLLARSALRGLLECFTGHGNWVIRADSVGKLFAETKAGAPGPFISLAHTPGMAACAVGDIGPLGIDVECHRPRAFAAIADYAFGPGERGLVEAQGIETFYRIWTLREAMGKATGQGLELVTDGRDRVLNDSESTSWLTRCDDVWWALTHCLPQPGFSLALAARADGKINDVGQIFELVAADTLL